MLCDAWTGHRVGAATVRVFKGGHSVGGSKTIKYTATYSDVTVGIIQILLHQLGQLCDQLLVRRELPDANQVDALLSEVFQNDSVMNAVPTVSFEKFLESYRFLADSGSASCRVLFIYNEIRTTVDIKGRGKGIALHGNPISELRDVTCHMGSHSVTCHPTQVKRPPA